MHVLQLSKKVVNFTKQLKNLLLKLKTPMMKLLILYKRLKDSLAHLEHSLESFFKAKAKLKQMFKEDQQMLKRKQKGM